MVCAASVTGAVACNLLLGNEEGSFDQGTPSDASLSGDGGLGEGDGSGDGGDLNDAGDSCMLDTGCVVVSGLKNISAIDVDDHSVYWTSDNSDPLAGKSLKTGGAAVAMSVVEASDSAKLGVWIGHDDLNVFWATEKNIRVRPRDALAKKYASAPPLSVVETTAITAATLGGGRLFWATSGDIRSCDLPECSNRTLIAANQGAIRLMEVANGRIYWATDGQLLACDLLGCKGPATPILSRNVRSMAFDDSTSSTRLFFAGTNSVYSCAIDTCLTGAFSLAGADTPYALTVGDGFAWWREGTNRISRCSRIGCNQEKEVFVLNQSNRNERTLKANDGYIYWATATEIRRKKY